MNAAHISLGSYNWLQVILFAVCVPRKLLLCDIKMSLLSQVSLVFVSFLTSIVLFSLSSSLHLFARYSVGVFAPHLGALIGVLLYDNVIANHLTGADEEESNTLHDSSRPIGTNDAEPLVEHIGTFYSSIAR